jgi:hypothetical protein
VQFGIAADPDMSQKWRQKGVVKDDPRMPQLGEGKGGPGGSFPKGGISFAGSGENSRSTQLFITYENGVVGSMPWENQIGTVIEGLDVVDSFYTGYGDMEMFNKGGVSPQKLETEGIAYAKENFPKLTFFEKCVVESMSEEYTNMPKDVSAVFENKGDKDVHLFWVEQTENKHFPQGTIKKGESINIGTFTGHKFVVKESESGPVVATADIKYEQTQYVHDGVGAEL